MSRLPDEVSSHRHSAQHSNRPKRPWQPRRLKVTLCLCVLAAATGLARLFWAPSPKVVMKQRPRALPLAAVHIVYTYDADCDDDMRGACQTSIEALLDNELPGVPRRSFASLPGAHLVPRSLRAPPALERAGKPQGSCPRHSWGGAFERCLPSLKHSPLF